MSQNKHEASAVATDICTHLHQCPNPLCQHVFTSQWGLSMPFYHQNSAIANHLLGSVPLWASVVVISDTSGFSSCTGTTESLCGGEMCCTNTVS